MTRVEIFEKWAKKDMTTEDAIKECKKSPEPNRIEDDYYLDSWALYDGDEDNLTSSLWLMEEDGYDRKTIKKFVREVVLVADKDRPKKKPNWVAAREVGMDTKQFQEAKKTGKFPKKFK